MTEQPLRNPFRSEADAFRLLVIVGLAFAAVIAAALLAGPLLAVPVGLVLAFLGARASWRWLRLSLSPREPEAGALAAEPTAPAEATADAEGADHAEERVRPQGERERRSEGL